MNKVTSSTSASSASSFQSLDRQAGQRYIVAPIVFVGVSVILCAVIGTLFGQLLLGAIAGLVIAVALTAGAIAKSDAIVLGALSAVPADPRHHQRLLNVVEGLSVTAGLSMPDVYVVDNDGANACVVAGGRDRNAVVVTSGLLARIDRIQMEGVVAHLVARIRSGQVNTLTRIAVLIGAPIIIGEALQRRKALAPIGRVLLLTAYVVGPLTRWLVGTQSDTLADVAACRLTRYPPALATALEEISQTTTHIDSASLATAHLWFADPVFSAKGAPPGRPRLHSLFASHSSIEERIALVKEM
jgi:heat shock protein HtpX